MPIWTIILIILFFVLIIAIITYNYIHINKCVENEIEAALIKKGLDKNACQKDEASYKLLKKDIKNKIIDHRSGYSLKPRYKRGDQDFINEVHKIVDKYY